MTKPKRDPFEPGEVVAMVGGYSLLAGTVFTVKKCHWMGEWWYVAVDGGDVAIVAHALQKVGD